MQTYARPTPVDVARSDRSVARNIDSILRLGLGLGLGLGLWLWLGKGVAGGQQEKQQARMEYVRFFTYSAPKPLLRARGEAFYQGSYSS